MGIFDNNYMNTMNKALDGLWTRQEAISDNLANFETPGYKRKTVSFESELSAALKGTGNNKTTLNNINNTKITVTEDNEKNRMDGNSVDLEQETLEMIRTTYQYMYAQRSMSDYFSRLSSAIKG